MSAEGVVSPRKGSTPCMLGYPDRFEAAVKYVKHARTGGKEFPPDTMLMLYALGHQAEKGPCNLSKPGGWLGGNTKEVAMWQSWKSLGNMSPFEAMRLYVRTVEEEDADWYAALIAAPDRESPDSGEARSASSYASTNQWTAAPQSGKQPLPRYEHAAAVLGTNLYVIGGNYSGRYLNDGWVLDLQTMTWTQLLSRKTPDGSAHKGSSEQAAAGDAAAAAAGPIAAGAATVMEQAAGTPTAAASSPGLPPLAGHTATPWADTLVILGGHVKPKDVPAQMPARVLDAQGHVVELTPSGEGPCARGGHSSVLIGRRLYVFGGEDAHRRALGDLWVLDLDDMAWSKPDTTGRAPSARSAHACAVFGMRYMLLFGGGSVATCFSDLHVLDTLAQPMQWSQPFVSGPKVSPRAGHCGAVVGTTWYLLGGGNNVKGCTEMLALDLRGLMTGGPLSWRSVASIAARDALSSEGSSLVALPDPAGSDGAPEADAASHVLLSFGGYNGKYQNTVSVMRVPGELSAGAAPPTPSKATAATASSNMPDKPEAPSTVSAAPPTPPAVPPEPSPREAELASQLEAAQQARAAAVRNEAAAKESTAQMRSQLDALVASEASANKGWDEAKSALAREREKSIRLEVEIAELKKKIADYGELQKEVESLKRTLKEVEDKKGGGGVWGYLSGNS